MSIEPQLIERYVSIDDWKFKIYRIYSKQTWDSGMVPTKHRCGKRICYRKKEGIWRVYCERCNMFMPIGIEKLHVRYDEKLIIGLPVPE